MKVTNKYNLPDSIVRAVQNDPYTYTGHISVTQLIKSPRQRWLEIRHNDLLEIDVTERLWTLMGSAVHHVLERVEDKHAEEFIEVRVSKQFGDYTVSGQADRWEAPGYLQDYKFTSVWATIQGAKPEWEQQLNMLAHLYRYAGFTVEKADIIAIYRDWSKMKAKQGGNYPQVGAEAVNVKLWPDEEVEQFMLDRLEVHMGNIDVPDDSLPFCTAKERWQKPNIWAVMKNKNKRATKLFEDEKEANEYAEELNRLGKEKYWVQFRPGENTRCEHYCPVKDFCNQYELITLGEEVD